MAAWTCSTIRCCADFGTHSAAYLDGTDEAEVRRAAEEAMAKGPLKLIVAETPPTHSSDRRSGADGAAGRRNWQAAG
jgi:hypothetical protein